jgi:membrane protein required for colicin V production
MHMNWVDYLFLAIIVYSMLSGAWIGFLAESVTLAGVAAGTMIAGLTYGSLGQVIGHLGVPKDARDWVAFVVAFLTVSLLFRMASIVARTVSRALIRDWSNRVAGALIGLLVGGMLCMFIVVTVAYFKVGPFGDPFKYAQIATSCSRWLKEYVVLLPKSMQSLPPFTGK